MSAVEYHVEAVPQKGPAALPIADEKPEPMLHDPVDVHGVSPVANPILMNWCGMTPLGRRTQVFRPKTEEEISAILVSSPDRKIRPIGSGLAYEAIAAVDDGDSVLVELSHFTGLERVDHENSTARFGAGTSVDSAIALLTEKGLMISCSPGVIGMQTLAGCVSTSTHGQGLQQSSFSDAIHSLRMVRANGDVVDIDASDGDFGAYIGSLGLLGIIVSISLKTSPLRAFICKKMNVSYEVFAERWIQWNEESEFCKAWWYPETDLVHVWRIDEDRGEIDAVLRADPTLNSTIDLLSGKMADHTKDPCLVGCQFATIDRFRNTTDQKGFLHEIVCKGIPVPQINCEIAVPLDQLPNALRSLRSWLDTNGTSTLHYPFIFRCTGPSEAWLSPAYGSAVCFIGFLVYLAHDGSWGTGCMEMMRSIQEALYPCQGIPHLGKHFCLDIWQPEHKLRRWNDFTTLCRRHDPRGQFLNRLLSKMFAPTST